MFFKRSADAGKKEVIVNPNKDNILICAIRMRDGKTLLNEIIPEKDFNEATLASNITVASTPKEPSVVILKTKEVGSDIVDGTAATAKALIVGTGNVGRSIGNLFTRVGNTIRENADEFDRVHRERLIKKAAEAVKKDQA